MNQSKSNDTLLIGCGVFAAVLAVSGLVCGGCLFTSATGLSKAVDAAAKAEKRMEVERRAKQQAPVKPGQRR